MILNELLKVKSSDLPDMFLERSGKNVELSRVIYSKSSFIDRETFSTLFFKNCFI
jgi:hypothetical protein